MSRLRVRCVLLTLLVACTADNLDYKGDVGDGGPGDGPAGDLSPACVAEICGDNKDNNCDGKFDEGCNGLGTFVSAAIGDDKNPGTQAQPLATINQGIQNALKIGPGT